jgi:pSer/pThr/pTyr-binding forkhead associated (FHA) protein
MTIGRHDSCDVFLPDRRVSRFHARITRQGKSFILEDLGSKNGTFVNGAPITSPYTLKDGDEIAIAFAFKLLFVDSGATAPLAPEEPILKLDKSTRKVWVRGKELSPPLSPLQFRLLELLYEASGRVVSREEIAQALWPEAHAGVTDQAIDAIIHRLRERLASLDPNAKFIETVRGHGFRLFTP